MIRQRKRRRLAMEYLVQICQCSRVNDLLLSNWSCIRFFLASKEHLLVDTHYKKEKRCIETLAIIDSKFHTFYDSFWGRDNHIPTINNIKNLILKDDDKIVSIKHVRVMFPITNMVSKSKCNNCI